MGKDLARTDVKKRKKKRKNRKAEVKLDLDFVSEAVHTYDLAKCGKVRARASYVIVFFFFS